MKKILPIFCFSLSSFLWGQTQIANSSLELWDNVGAPTEEPSNWNSFKTGSGSFASFANKQIERSTNVRAGASGMYCARIWSTSVLGIVANGTMTCGRINMGSTTPANSANYNYSSIADSNFSEPCNIIPDSVVFWVKYTQAGGGNQTARIHAIVHDAFDAHDPIDANSQSHVLATAELNYSPTGGNWERKSIPFLPTANTGLIPEYILMTFATNSTPGGGAANDEVLLDDIQLIYNSGAGLNPLNETSFRVHYANGTLNFFQPVDGTIHIYSLEGKLQVQKAISGSFQTALNPGTYFLTYTSGNGKTEATKFVVE